MHRDVFQALLRRVEEGKALNERAGSFGGENSPWSEADAFAYTVRQLANDPSDPPINPHWCDSCDKPTSECGADCKDC